MSSRFFPRHLDKMAMVGPFEMDEIAVGGACGVVFYVLRAFVPYFDNLIVTILGVIGCILVFLAYHRFKRDVPDGYIFQKLYKMGIYDPADLKKTVLKYPHIRRMRTRIVPFGFVRTFYE